MKTTLESYLNLVQLNELDYLQELEILEEFSLNIDNVKAYVNKMINVCKQELRSYNINISRVEQIGRNLKGNILKYYKQGTTPEQASKLILKEISGKIIAEVKKLSIPKKILIGLCACFIILILNTAVGAASSLFFSPVTSIYLTFAICGPMFEEVMKSYFIEKGMPYIGTAIFAGLEAAAYIVSLVHKGQSLLTALIGRAIGVLIHFGLLFIQKSIYKPGEQKLGENEDDQRFKAFLLAFSIHAAWNTFAVTVAFVTGQTAGLGIQF